MYLVPLIQSSEIERAVKKTTKKKQKQKKTCNQEQTNKHGGQVRDSHLIISLFLLFFSFGFAVNFAPFLFLHSAIVFRDQTYCTVLGIISTSFHHANFGQNAAVFLHSTEMC